MVISDNSHQVKKRDHHETQIKQTKEVLRQTSIHLRVRHFQRGNNLF